MKKNGLILFIYSTVILSASSSWAVELSGQIFREQIEFKGETFRLNGLGLKSQFFIKIFAAGFYIGEDVSSDQISEDVPKELEVVYFYPIPGKKLAVETRKRIAQNISPDQFNEIKKRVNQMDHYFVDLKPGDRYALIYLPGQGTYFTYNGQELGVIEGYDFAKAIFSVWIGEKPVSLILKQQLLNEDKENVL
jgi:hypothetical protein